MRLRITRMEQGFVVFVTRTTSMNRVLVTNVVQDYQELLSCIHSALLFLSTSSAGCGTVALIVSTAGLRTCPRVILYQCTGRGGVTYVFTPGVRRVRPATADVLKVKMSLQSRRRSRASMPPPPPQAKHYPISLRRRLMSDSEAM